MTRHARITGWGRYVPANRVTNHDLERRLDTTDEWIRSRTGIAQRYIADDNETAGSMGIQAARRALEVADIDPASIDLVVAATCTADMIFPSCASQIQHGIGATRAGAFDVNAACSGFVYALATASQFLATGAYRRALVVGTEVFSRILDWTDRSTCVLFGDGAGALVLEGVEGEGGVLSFVLGSDGAGQELLYVPGIGRPDTARADVACMLRMNGAEVFRFAVKVMEDAAREAVLRAGLTMHDVKLFIPHQANQRIIKTASKSLGVPPERVFTNVERYANTSAASVPIALSEAADHGLLQPGDNVVLVGFGGGLSWAASLVQWTESVARLAEPSPETAGLAFTLHQQQ
jgi:3-oxoacyl-[acyl-carrier-protein] synthase-3